jgi:Ca-activated chloride channel family protein
MSKRLLAESAAEGASVLGGESPDRRSNTEAYDQIDDNQWTAVGRKPLSTFSIDVDSASYAN